MDSNALLAEKIEALEGKYAEHDQQFQLVFEAINQLIAADTAANNQPTREIGFHSRREPTAGSPRHRLRRPWAGRTRRSPS